MYVRGAQSWQKSAKTPKFKSDVSVTENADKEPGKARTSSSSTASPPPLTTPHHTTPHGPLRAPSGSTGRPLPLRPARPLGSPPRPGPALTRSGRAAPPAAAPRRSPPPWPRAAPAPAGPRGCARRHRRPPCARAATCGVTSSRRA